MLELNFFFTFTNLFCFFKSFHLLTSFIFCRLSLYTPFFTTYYLLLAQSLSHTKLLVLLLFPPLYGSLLICFSSLLSCSGCTRTHFNLRIVQAIISVSNNHTPLEVFEAPILFVFPGRFFKTVLQALPALFYKQLMSPSQVALGNLSISALPRPFQELFCSLLLMARIIL